MKPQILLRSSLALASLLLSVHSAAADNGHSSRKHLQVERVRVDEEIAIEDPVSVARAAKVKDAMLHAWSSYEKFAWGFDELQPQTKDGVDTFGGLGATVVDALDTLFIMGLNEQFQRARQWVATSLDFNKDYDASVFETTIRLLPAWNTPSGINLNRVNLATGQAHNANGKYTVLAEVGTEQLEFIALSQRTNDTKYQQKVENVIKKLQKSFPVDGLVPINIDPKTGRPSPSIITFGGGGDSFYEYLLKAWVQGNKTEAVNFY
ncbi:hypothetical protein CRG98_026956, partial [Punica granatum]